MVLSHPGRAVNAGLLFTYRADDKSTEAARPAESARSLLAPSRPDSSSFPLETKACVRKLIKTKNGLHLLPLTSFLLPLVFLMTRFGKNAHPQTQEAAKAAG